VFPSESEIPREIAAIAGGIVSAVFLFLGVVVGRRI
jgi:hypothetical protein